MNTAEMSIALKAKYPTPQYAILFEVRNQTGFALNRETYADAICMDLYPSKGLYLNGFEFKVSRPDLMHELKNPEKHLEISKHCNFWWLVVGDSKIIQNGELPEAWGLMVPHGKNLIIKKHAQFREVDHIPIHFVASLLRSALRASPAEQEIRVAVDRAILNDRKIQEQHGDYQKARLVQNNKRMKERIDKFQELSGVEMDHYNYDDIGKAVKFILDGGLKGVELRMMEIKKKSDIISDMAESVINKDKGDKREGFN